MLKNLRAYNTLFCLIRAKPDAGKMMKSNQKVCINAPVCKPKPIQIKRILNTLYQQREQIHPTHTNCIDQRIVTIHQPYLRPIVRGKQAKAEFGSKLQVNVVNGFTFIDHLSWDAFTSSAAFTAISRKV